MSALDDLQRCPECRSADILPTNYTPKWRCMACGAFFDKPWIASAEPQEPSATPSTLERLLKFLQWERTLCGACGETYKRCRVCQIGTRGGFSTNTGAQCGGHRDTACADDCLAVAALRPSEGPPSTREPFSKLRAEMSPESQARAAAQTEQILTRRPSEGPETGRPPAGVNWSTVRELLTDIYASHRDPNDHDSDWTQAQDVPCDWCEKAAVVLAALPAGPETGDRERRMRELATSMAFHNHCENSHPESFDVCIHDDCVLVRQAAPAASGE